MAVDKVDVEHIAFRDDGLKAIRNLINVSEAQYHPWEEKKLAEQVNARKVLHMLEKIGLLSFLREVWSAQDLLVCIQFVQNWDPDTTSTYVSGSFIDASFHNFASVTSGFLSDNGPQAEAACTSVAKMNSPALRKALSYFKPAPNRIPEAGFMLDQCNQSTVKAVLKLLNMTLWAKASRHNRVCGDLLYLVVQAAEGTRFNWKKLFHDKFIWELNRLKALLEEQDRNVVGLPRLHTVLGPVMCYLYGHRQREYLIESRLGPHSRREPNTAPLESSGLNEDVEAIIDTL